MKNVKSFELSVAGAVISKVSSQSHFLVLPSRTTPATATPNAICRHAGFVSAETRSIKGRAASFAERSSESSACCSGGQRSRQKEVDKACEWELQRISTRRLDNHGSIGGQNENQKAPTGSVGKPPAGSRRVWTWTPYRMRQGEKTEKLAGGRRIKTLLNYALRKMSSPVRQWRAYCCKTSTERLNAHASSSRWFERV